ncbi:MAG: HlyD family secretion protein [Anaerolineales bacterium]
MSKVKSIILMGAVALTALSITGCDALGSNEEDALKASGIVEADEVAVSSEVGARVAEVFAEKGDGVAAGDKLYRLDDEFLQTERGRLVAAGNQAITGAKLQLLIAEQGLRDLEDDWLIIAAQARLTLANATDALDDSEKYRNNQQEGQRASETTIKNARAELTLAEKALKGAKSKYDSEPGSRREDAGKASAYKAYAAAQQRYDAALRSYNWYTGHPTGVQQEILDAEVALAEASVADSQAEWEKWKDGPDPAQLELAIANVDNALAQLELAEADAEVQLANMDLQLSKYLILSSVDGTILTHNVEVGEIVLPGAPTMIIGQLDDLTITVFIPEDQYGLVSIGDTAEVSVDSFPDRTFSAIVISIANEAEFTPRNVQTEEERRTTVFAVELAVEDSDRMLKPGMPADVFFSTGIK